MLFGVSWLHVIPPSSPLQYEPPYCTHSPIGYAKAICHLIFPRGKSCVTQAALFCEVSRGGKRV